MRSRDLPSVLSWFHLHSLKGKIVVVVEFFEATSTMVGSFSKLGFQKSGNLFADLEMLGKCLIRHLMRGTERLTPKVFELGNSPSAILNDAYTGKSCDDPLPWDLRYF